MHALYAKHVKRNCARSLMSDIENFVADIVSAEKVPHTQGSLPLEVVVQSRKFPSTTSKHRKDPWTQSLLQLGLEVVVSTQELRTTRARVPGFIPGSKSPYSGSYMHTEIVRLHFVIRLHLVCMLSHSL